ncbi:MAG: hypothetical protein ACR2HX_19145 [Pyrinomonadaceae bacterium]
MDELRLRPDYDRGISKILPALGLLIFKDELLREFAFTESEAKDYLEKQRGISEMKNVADEIKALREFLGLQQS